MSSFNVKVVDVNGNTVSGKTVKACKQGFDKTCYTVDTDSNGIANFNINAWNETVQVEALGLSSGTATVQIDLLGNPKPDFVVLRTTFNPAGQIGGTINKIADYGKGLGVLGIVVVALIIGLIIFLVVRKSVSTGSMPKLPKIPFIKK